MALPTGSTSITDPSDSTRQLKVNADGSINVSGGGGGGGGGAVTVADGADVAQGTTTDANTANTVIGRLTKIRDLLNAAIPVGTNEIGAILLRAATGVALAADQTNSILRISNYIKTTTAGDTPLTAGQTTSANSLPVVIASDQSSVSIKQPTSATGTITSVAGTITASTSLLASNANRKGMMIYNESTAILYLGFSATVTTSSYTLQIPAQSFFEMPTAPVYTGVIAGVWSAATGNARITELT